MSESRTTPKELRALILRLDAELNDVGGSEQDHKEVLEDLAATAKDISDENNECEPGVAEALDAKIAALGSAPTPPSYTAYIDVVDYDDDFVLIVDGMVVDEGTRSAVFTGRTEAEALWNLLRVTKATDRHLTFGVDAPVHDGYHHVRAVRHTLAAMLAVCGDGKMPELHWGGNWDITFRVVPKEEAEGK